MQGGAAQAQFVQPQMQMQPQQAPQPAMRSPLQPMMQGQPMQQQWQQPLAGMPLQRGVVQPQPQFQGPMAPGPQAAFTQFEPQPTMQGDTIMLQQGYRMDPATGQYYMAVGPQGQPQAMPQQAPPAGMPQGFQQPMPPMMPQGQPQQVPNGPQGPQQAAQAQGPSFATNLYNVPAHGPNGEPLGQSDPFFLVTPFSRYATPEAAVQGITHLHNLWKESEGALQAYAAREAAIEQREQVLQRVLSAIPAENRERYLVEPYLPEDLRGKKTSDFSVNPNDDKYQVDRTDKRFRDKYGEFDEAKYAQAVERAKQQYAEDQAAADEARNKYVEAYTSAVARARDEIGSVERMRREQIEAERQRADGAVQWLQGVIRPETFGGSFNPESNAIIESILRSQKDGKTIIQHMAEIYQRQGPEVAQFILGAVTHEYRQQTFGSRAPEFYPMFAGYAPNGMAQYVPAPPAPGTGNAAAVRQNVTPQNALGRMAGAFGTNR